MKVKGSLDISELYDLVFKFDECVDTSFKETTTELDTIRSRLSRWGQEIANLEGGHYILEKEIESLRECLNAQDEVIAELCGAVEFLTDKRCHCNDNKVSPCS